MSSPRRRRRHRDAPHHLGDGRQVLVLRPGRRGRRAADPGPRLAAPLQGAEAPGALRRDRGRRGGRKRRWGGRRCTPVALFFRSRAPHARTRTALAVRARAGPRRRSGAPDHSTGRRRPSGGDRRPAWGRCTPVALFFRPEFHAPPPADDPPPDATAADAAPNPLPARDLARLIAELQAVTARAEQTLKAETALHCFSPPESPPGAGALMSPPPPRPHQDEPLVIPGNAARRYPGRDGTGPHHYSAHPSEGWGPDHMAG